MLNITGPVCNWAQHFLAAQFWTSTQWFPCIWDPQAEMTLLIVVNYCIMAFSPTLEISSLRIQLFSKLFPLKTDKDWVFFIRSLKLFKDYFSTFPQDFFWGVEVGVEMSSQLLWADFKCIKLRSCCLRRLEVYPHLYQSAVLSITNP